VRGCIETAGWIALIAALAVAPTPARADSTHYQTLQLGERSRGMAAAYTAFAADGAAIWFNPAGLPLLEPKLLQGSLSLIQRRTLDIEGAIITDGPDGIGGEDQVEDFQIKSSPSLPGFAVAAFAVGKRKEALGNRKPVQFAISAFQTYNQSQGGDVNWQDTYGRTNSIQFYQSDTATWFGAGMGYRPNKHFSFGVTLLARNRNLEHVETAAVALGGTQDPSQGSPCPTSPTIPFCILDANQSNRNTVFTMSSWDLTLRFGILNLFGKRWRFGVMFQPPGLRVGGKSNLRFEANDVNSSTFPINPDQSNNIFGNRQFDSRSPIPWELRLGMSYVISKRVVVAADLQLVGRVADGSIAPGIPQLEGRANTSGILLADSTKRDFTWNVSLGSEIQITKFLFTRFGFLTDNSSAPDNPGTATFLRPAKIDRIGFSASIGGHKNNKGLSAGVSMLFGKGEGNGLDLRGEAFITNANFTRTNVKERILIISIGGDIGQTADVVKTRMKEKKADQAVEADEAKAAEERRLAMEGEEDPVIKEAKQRAIEARKQLDEAKQEVKEADDALEKLETTRKKNLSGSDQGAIQGATQTGIETVR
jgi:long-subunit fatty acid transport protein